MLDILPFLFSSNINSWLFSDNSNGSLSDHFFIVWRNGSSYDMDLILITYI